MVKIGSKQENKYPIINNLPICGASGKLNETFLDKLDGLNSEFTVLELFQWVLIHSLGITELRDRIEIFLHVQSLQLMVDRVHLEETF